MTPILGHLGALLEPLLFAPAFVAVFWSIYRYRRQHDD